MVYKKVYEFEGRTWANVQEEIAHDDIHSEIYCSNNPLIKWLFEKRFEIIYNLIATKKHLKLLDVGCGDGFFLDKIKDIDLEVYGIDISKKRIERAAKKSRATLFQCVAEKMPFKKNFFDIIVCTDVLEHVQNPLQVINEIKRVCKENGIVFVSFPNELLWMICRALLLRFPIKIVDHINTFSIKSIDRYFELKHTFAKYIPHKFFNLASVVGYNIKKF
jgi:2-polyprenyl-3-methyl-5-hydroxy-6-metoxy-1,4-benzoquinol methylase